MIWMRIGLGYKIDEYFQKKKINQTPKIFPIEHLGYFTFDDDTCVADYILQRKVQPIANILNFDNLGLISDSLLLT